MSSCVIPAIHVWCSDMYYMSWCMSYVSHMHVLHMYHTCNMHAVHFIVSLASNQSHYISIYLTHFPLLRALNLLLIVEKSGLLRGSSCQHSFTIFSRLISIFSFSLWEVSSGRNGGVSQFFTLPIKSEI